MQTVCFEIQSRVLVVTCADVISYQGSIVFMKVYINLYRYPLYSYVIVIAFFPNYAMFVLNHSNDSVDLDDLI